MDHLDFNGFSHPVNAKFQAMAADTNSILAVVGIDTDALYEMYQQAYPQEINTVFRERRQYDGSYDKQYIRRMGNIVSIKPEGTIDTIWNVTVPGYFQAVADCLHSAVSSAAVKTIYLTDLPLAGSKPNKDNVLDIVWSHFYSQIPSQYVRKGTLDSEFGEFNSSVGVFTRGLTGFTQEAFETVLELINSNSIYRGTEFKAPVADFYALKKKYDSVPAMQKNAWVIYTAKKAGPAVRFKNTVIGTLVEDLSGGETLEKAVASFESKVAPQNYKRPTALVTPAMIKAAKEKLAELNLLDSLDRRFATPSDISINNLLFCATVDKATDVFAEMSQESSSKAPRTLDKVEDISLDKFLSDVLPTARSLEVLMEGRFKPNLMSILTAVYPSSTHLFKWGNHFSWAYAGNITDAVKENVKTKGGDVDGDFRASVNWYNADDIDLAVSEPDRTLINCFTFRRKTTKNGGMLDVDMNGMDRHDAESPIENIFYKDKSRMAAGEYKVILDQYSKRGRNNEGFVLQVELDGEIHNFMSERPFVGRHVHMLTVKWDGVKFSLTFVNKDLTPTGVSGKDVGGVKAETYVPVTMVMNSPNLWGEKPTGNDHVFFILDKCRMEDATRGFFNEFLKPELSAHRKVLEVLGDKIQVTPKEGEDQVSGIGFNRSTRTKLTVRVKGNTQRTFTINI